MQERQNISGEVAAALRERIVNGDLAPNTRINEVHLARDLGVSRTPLREALARLAQEGALRNAPRIGYFVRPLTIEEFEQIYDIRPILDPEALRLAGIPSKKRIDELEALNRKLAAARDPETAITLDDEWHFSLLADCPNRVLIEMIESIILRTRRYELALMKESENVATASNDHARILAALRKGDLPAACAALKRNMQSGRAPIVAWLKQRDSTQRK